MPRARERSIDGAASLESSAIVRGGLGAHKPMPVDMAAAMAWRRWIGSDRRSTRAGKRDRRANMDPEVIRWSNMVLHWSETG